MKFKQRTADGALRQPTFLRLRDDKPAAECVWPGGAEPEPDDAGRRRARRRVRPGAGTADGRPHESRQGLLAGRGLHERRHDRVLPEHRGVVLAVSERPARRAHALPRRHRRQVVLPEGRAGVRAEVAAPRDDVERAGRARDPLLRARRHRVAHLCREHGLDPAARMVEPRRRARAARLVHPRPRPERGAVQGRRDHRALICTSCATTWGSRTT